MIGITIDRKKYLVRNFWFDITIKDFISVSKIEIPETAKKLFLSSVNEKEYIKNYLEITDATWEGEFFNYYIDVIAALSNIPKQILQNTESDIVTNFFDIYLKHIAYSIVFNTPLDFVDGKYQVYEPKSFASFKYRGHKWYFPKSLQLNGEAILMADEQVISMVEASDLDLTMDSLSDGKASNLLLFTAIYCRRYKEVYSQKSVLERKETFMHLSMDKVWSLFFCIGIASKRFTRCTRLSLMAREIKTTL